MNFEESFREIGIADFFRKNLHMLGYSGKIKSLTTVIHEYVSNSLDACEEAGILPDIYVRISRASSRTDHYTVLVRDNGPGVPVDYLHRVFGKMLTGTKFHRYIQSRGQQGIGAVGAILYSQITAGKPVKILSSVGDGYIHTLIMEINIKENKSHIYELATEEGEARGISIEAEYKNVLYTRTEQGVFEYLKRTAVANPHLKLTLEEPDGNIVEFPRTSSELPPPPKEIKPHPLGLSADDLREFAKKTSARTLKQFLIEEFSRISPAKAEETIKLSGINPNKKPEYLSHEEAEKIANAFSKIKFMAPSTDCLIPIGSERIYESLVEIVNPEFCVTANRKPCIYRGGVPFQVEAGIAYGGSAGRSTSGGRRLEVMRFANRAPLLFDAGGCVITEAVSSIHWQRYNLKDITEHPITIFINVISPHIPYTSTGKQAISNEQELFDEIRNALMEVGRKLARYLTGKKREAERKLKKDIFMRYIDEISISLEEITGENRKIISQALEKIVKKRLDIDAG